MIYSNNMNVIYSYIYYSGGSYDGAMRHIRRMNLLSNRYPLTPEQLHNVWIKNKQLSVEGIAKISFRNYLRIGFANGNNWF